MESFSRPGGMNSLPSEAPGSAFMGGNVQALPFPSGATLLQRAASAVNGSSVSRPQLNVCASAGVGISQSSPRSLDTHLSSISPQDEVQHCQFAQATPKMAESNMEAIAEPAGGMEALRRPGSAVCGRNASQPQLNAAATSGLRGSDFEHATPECTQGFELKPSCGVVDSMRPAHTGKAPSELPRARVAQPRGRAGVAESATLESTQLDTQAECQISSGTLLQEDQPLARKLFETHLQKESAATVAPSSTKGFNSSLREEGRSSNSMGSQEGEEIDAMHAARTTAPTKLSAASRVQASLSCARRESFVPICLAGPAKMMRQPHAQTESPAPNYPSQVSALDGAVAQTLKAGQSSTAEPEEGITAMSASKRLGTPHSSRRQKCHGQHMPGQELYPLPRARQLNGKDDEENQENSSGPSAVPPTVESQGEGVAPCLKRNRPSTFNQTVLSMIQPEGSVESRAKAPKHLLRPDYHALDDGTMPETPEATPASHTPAQSLQLEADAGTTQEQKASTQENTHSSELSYDALPASLRELASIAGGGSGRGRGRTKAETHLASGSSQRDEVRKTGKKDGLDLQMVLASTPPPSEATPSKCGRVKSAWASAATAVRSAWSAAGAAPAAAMALGDEAQSAAILALDAKAELSTDVRAISKRPLNEQSVAPADASPLSVEQTGSILEAPLPVPCKRRKTGKWTPLPCDGTREAASVESKAVKTEDDDDIAAPGKPLRMTMTLHSAEDAPSSSSECGDDVQDTGCSQSSAMEAEPRSGPLFSATGIELTVRQRRTLTHLGGELTDEWSPDITHIIADTFRRTNKIMCGICRGVKLVSPDYVNACRLAGKLVDEERFLLHDAVCEAAFARRRGIPGGYSLAKALQRVREHGPLLKGMSVYCFPSVTTVVEQSELPMLVAAAGGKWLHRFPASPDDKKVLLLAERAVSSEREQRRRQRHEVYDIELLREAACTQILRHGAYRLR